MIYLAKAARQFAETGFPGLRSFTLWGENGTGSDILEFKAGSRFPLHDHEGPEEVLVLSGRIRFGDLMMSAGDYLKIGPGEEHDAEAIEDSLFFLSHVGGPVLKDCVPGLDPEVARALIHAAHEICAYSKATRGPIAVETHLV